MTHDYIRHGTTTLFAALNVLDGRVIGQCMQRHRHQEFLLPLHTDLGFLAQCRRGLLRQAHPAPPATLFHSLVDLQATINRYLAEHNHNPKPFVWTADPQAIIAAASRGYQVLDSVH